MGYKGEIGGVTRLYVYTPRLGVQGRDDIDLLLVVGMEDFFFFFWYFWSFPLIFRDT